MSSSSGGIGRGIGDAARGFGWWKRNPRVMAIGLIPAILAALLLTAAVVLLAGFIVPIVTVITPFANDWDTIWVVLLRIGLGIGLVAGSAYLAFITFTTLTLALGSPFYDRIWRDVERTETGVIPDAPDLSVATVIAESISMIVRGVGVAILTLLCGFVPVVGWIFGPVVGFLLTAALLTEELTARAFEARGIDSADRRRLLRGSRGRARGFGWGIQACFMVPFGAIVAMPTGVAGGTLLVQALVPSGADTAP